MKRDKIYRDIGFNTDFSVEDWNSLVKLRLRKYLINETVFEDNKEVLRSEAVNYMRFCTKPEYLQLFEWTYNLHRDCISIDRQKTIKMLADSFHDGCNTDMKWMTNVLTQPDHTAFSERDKISYYFKVVDETLEGVFKQRFKLLTKLVNFKLNLSIIDNTGFDFGKLIRDFPGQLQDEARLFLSDPLFSISTNQWRNIAAHKSFVIDKNNVIIKYGKKNTQTLIITFEDFYKIVYWTQDIYRVIRLAQVLTDLNYIEEIVAMIGGINNISIRFESKLLHIIHNMQVVGFEFVSTEEGSDTFYLNIKGKKNHDIKSSLIHASQCLDQLSCAIYDDKFVRDNFKKTQISIVDETQNKLASATIAIEVALKMAEGKITLNEYLDNMKFEITC